MSTSEDSIDAGSVQEIARVLKILEEAAAIGDTDIHWLAADGGPIGAIVTPDVVRAAKLYWDQIRHELIKNLGLPKL